MGWPDGYDISFTYSSKPSILLYDIVLGWSSSILGVRASFVLIFGVTIAPSAQFPALTSRGHIPPTHICWGSLCFGYLTLSSVCVPLVVVSVFRILSMYAQLNYTLAVLSTLLYIDAFGRGVPIMILSEAWLYYALPSIGYRFSSLARRVSLRPNQTSFTARRSQLAVLSFILLRPT